MCGIAGAGWSIEGEPVSRETLRAMTDAVQHRGPDGRGEHFANIATTSTTAGNARLAGVALGHRRLSIIDLATGAQPLSNEDGTVWITFNGEIYNYRELATELRQAGHRFATDSDTEVIVHAYEQWGTACLDRLRGMFAFAIYDQNQQRLFLARDRFGKKPLVYRVEPGRILFASELKSLLAVPGVPREVDRSVLAEYLCYKYVPHPHSILKGVAKLPPGTFLTFDLNRGVIDQPPTTYWRYPCQQPNSTSDEQATARSLRECLTDAVRLRMRSDVPLGAFLSGGIDSTLITGLMQQASEKQVQTFSIGFEEPKFDERSYARLAADQLGTKHHELVVKPSALGMLDDLVYYYDEPFSDSSAIPTMLLSRFARQHVTVALSGDGGDELFGGYDRYRAMKLAANLDMLPGWLRRLAAASAAWLPTSAESKTKMRQVRRFLEGIGDSTEDRYFGWVSELTPDHLACLLTTELANECASKAPVEFLKKAYQLFPGNDRTLQTMAVDTATYLPCDILTKVDIASMSCGLECRSPLLDQEVANLAARLPLSAKIRGQTGKWILQETFADIIPAAICQRPKMGFGVPLNDWFRGELQPRLREVLLDERSLGRGYFQPETIRRWVDEHTSAKVDHSPRLWSLLILELWHQRWIDR